MIFHSMTEYLKAKESWENTRWRCGKDGNFAFINGEWISEDEYYANNSKPVYQLPQTENSDKTFLYLGVPSTKRQK